MVSGEKWKNLEPPASTAPAGVVRTGIIGYFCYLKGKCTNLAKAIPNVLELLSVANGSIQNHIVLIFLLSNVLSNLPKTHAERHPPKHTQIERVYNESHSILWDCEVWPGCRPSSGLSVECGTSVSINKKIGCKPCILGKTYSNSHDFHTCQPCRSCSKNQFVTGKCTLEEDGTDCGKCKVGYYEDVTGDCHECTWCCNNSEDRRMSDCAGMPDNQQCKKQEQSIKCASGTTSMASQPTGHDKSSFTLPIILGVIAGVVLMAILVAVVWKIRHKLQSYIGQLQRAFCRLHTSSLRETYTDQHTLSGVVVHSDPDSAVMSSNMSGNNKLSSGNVEPESINVDVVTTEQESEDHPPEISVNLPQHQCEDEWMQSADNQPRNEGLCNGSEKSPRSERRDLLDGRVSTLPLKYYRKICVLLNEVSGLVPNFQDLGERVGLETWEVRGLSQSKNPADAVIQRFDASRDGNIRTFIGHLDQLKRDDVICVFREWMKEKCPFRE